MKICKNCGLEKERVDFSQHPKTKDGLNSYCKKCACEKTREYLKNKRADEQWIIRERARNRKKYFKLNYKGKYPYGELNKKEYAKKYREKYPEITLVGTIDDSEMLNLETPEGVRTSVKKSIDTLGKKGGYIPGPTNFLLDQPPENIVACYKAIQEFGTY